MPANSSELLGQRYFKLLHTGMHHKNLEYNIGLHEFHEWTSEPHLRERAQLPEIGAGTATN